MLMEGLPCAGEDRDRRGRECQLISLEKEEAGRQARSRHRATENKKSKEKVCSSVSGCGEPL
jgi:hypothetical protein